MIVVKKCPVCLCTECLPYDDQDWMIAGISYRLLRCRTCDSTFTSPLPSDGVLENLYRTSFDYRWYQDHYEAKLRDCRMRVKEYGSELGNRVMDFGGGVGYFSKAASEAGLESITYDPFIGAKPPNERFDSVVALHVLEHSNDLDKTITQIKSFLIPGGHLIMAVPNFASLGYKKLGMQWVWAQPPLMHVFHFTAAGLQALLSRHGFTDLKVTYHERWDANLYSDLEHVQRFRALDADWSKLPFNWIPQFRRWIARRNSQHRFDGLKEAFINYDINRDASAELQITGMLSNE